MIELDSAYISTLRDALHFLRISKIDGLKSKLTDPVPTPIHVQTIKGIAAELQLLDDIDHELRQKGGEATAC